MVCAMITFTNEEIKRLMFDSWDNLTTWVEKHHDDIVEVEAKQA